MADIINLRAARKSRDREARRAQADQNAARFGRTKAARAADLAVADKDKRDLDGHRRVGAAPEGDAVE